MKQITNRLIVCVVGCMLLAMTSCVKETVEVSVGGGGSSVTPLSHKINQWLSTDWEGDEITMFITDSPKDIRFLSSSGATISIEMNDCFVAKYISWGTTTITTSTSNGSNSLTSTSCSTSGRITPQHVGVTFLHIQDSLFDTIIPVKVLGEYYTYTEPGLDFDDTEDSVRAKLLKTFSLYAYNPDEHYYQVEDSRCRYNLYVNYANDGKVDNYMADLFQGVDTEELIGYIGERYYKTTAYSNGLPVYIKAVNVSSPSISDASVVVIPDNASHKVTYKNPMTYSN